MQLRRSERRFKQMKMTILRKVFSLGFALTLVLSLAGQSNARLINEAENYYEAGRFRNALQYFRQGGNLETWNKSTKLQVAICQYAINDLESCIRTLNRLVAEGKTNEDVYFYLARAHQQRTQFQEAIEYYKQFIKKVRSNDTRIPWVKDEILRCSVGKSLKHGEETAYVENLGARVNTFYDEYGPVPSPNYPNRIYLNAAREESMGGFVTVNGKLNNRLGHPGYDIFFTELRNGSWEPLQLLEAPVNSDMDEHLLAFSPTGQALFFSRGPENRGVLHVDSFAVTDQNYQNQGVELNTIDPHMRDIFLFNDTILLFSSDIPGGYGGLDIYSSVKSRGSWQTPVNLGPAINSFYDERCPFLTRSGRVLYYSSNSLNSIGGYDVFRVVFDDQLTAWRKPVNMGLPVNSAADDTHWYLASDGLSAFLSSDRKTGYGKRDLYVAYLKAQVQEHLAFSHPATFAQFAEPGSVIEAADLSEAQAKVKEYFISNLYFDGEDQVLTPQNLKKLNLLVNMLKIYPDVQLVFTSHDISSGPKAFDLYFSIKKAEKAAEFLARNGIPAHRMVIRGAGAQYPLAHPSATGLRSPIVDRLNNRMEIKVINAEEQPLKLIYEKPNIPENVRDTAGIQFQKLSSGLVYRVQAVSVNHLYQNPILEEDYDVLVELDPDSGNYRYLIGMEKMFGKAIILRDQLRDSGFSDAFIVPFINDKKIGKAQLTAYVEEYPDLQNMMDR